MDFTTPTPIQRELRGLLLCHHHTNQVRTQVLAEILKAYHYAGIEVLLLKGAALAYWANPGYSETIKTLKIFEIFRVWTKQKPQRLFPWGLNSTG